jgi:hypothetical protein
MAVRAQPSITADTCLLPTEEANKVVMRIYIYIENTTSKAIKIPLPDRGPSSGVNILLYYIGIQKTSGGRLIKPSPRELNIIELKPGELTELAIHDIVITKNSCSQLKQEIKYVVSDEIKSFYSLWTGTISYTVDMRTSLRKAEGTNSSMTNKTIEYNEHK